MADPESFLEENLAALSHRDPELARLVRAHAPDRTISSQRARNGALVPVVSRPGGRVAMHSVYDPQRESRRLAQGTKGAGFLVFFGLGAGFHVEAALEDQEVSTAVVLEKDVAVLRALLQGFPLARLLRDARVRLGAGLSSVRHCLLQAWQPALMGSLQTLALRPWCDAQDAYFSGAAAELQRVIEEVRSDYSVQAHFGRTWFSHMLLNLEAADRPLPSPPSGAVAHVTAAGPSLEKQMTRISGARREGLLIATDTSLPALQRWGIRPDAVISVDCQIYSSLHFLQGVPAETTVFLDLASPPILARGPGRRTFITSAHPFARYIAARWRRFPHVDTSGGNVAHAAVSLARHLGARRITLYGADFSYPDGKPYSRGTYLYDLFDSTQRRTSPTENSSYSFMHRSAGETTEAVGDRRVLTTAVLRAYRDRMAHLVREIDAEVIAAPGDGLPLPPGHGVPDTPAPTPGSTAPPTAGLAWRELLSRYAEELTGIDPSAGSVGARYLQLDRAERELWDTILPIAARVVAEQGGEAAGAVALAEARRWALARISRLLGR